MSLPCAEPRSASCERVQILASNFLTRRTSRILLEVLSLNRGDADGSRRRQVLELGEWPVRIPAERAISHEAMPIPHVPKISSPVPRPHEYSD